VRGRLDEENDTDDFSKKSLNTTDMARYREKGVADRRKKAVA